MSTPLICLHGTFLPVKTGRELMGGHLVVVHEVKHILCRYFPENLEL
jgi:hypothetical protein